MDKNFVIFDLDGTLIDSSADIAWVANGTLSAMGRAEMDEGEIRSKIGWGINMLMRQLMPDEDSAGIMRARSIFLDLYASHLVVETVLYDGVVETLDLLADAGLRMAVVSNKPEALSIAIIERFGLDRYFDVVLGGDSLSVRKPEPGPLIFAMGAMRALPVTTVMVGDSPIDCEAGQRAGVSSIGAAYGFRGTQELVSARADMIIDGFGELAGILL